ncbi:hypothetical protein GCM10010156_12580 [Planobispora rosea]|uniref:Uncharacterized protein n=1 Tax=Planobispora rosea TaxID=35762 RepID=A0A8J3RYJ7_PLARO|nr:hypothetical protein [Planobispora rosea]GGS55563.1 hypothetical protein GCM10010156_12580 [Planobispora rosea]GIH83670.1 hypothetical protein Pro02_20780 [Planobispora rosea]
MIKVDRTLHIDILCAHLPKRYAFPDAAREIVGVLRAARAEGFPAGPAGVDTL